MKNSDYVLYTSEDEYVVEFLLNQLVLSRSITKAMTFDNKDIAIEFKALLLRKFDLKCSVNTYIK